MRTLIRTLTIAGVAPLIVGLTIVIPACSRKSAPAAQTPATRAALPTAPPSKPAVAASTPPTVPDGPAAPADIAALHERVDTIAHLVDTLPQLADLDAAAQALHTPEAAFMFVRDQVANELYRGVQKGAWGALATRGANDLDKALLLAALLKAQHVDAQLAHGTIDAAAQQKLAAEPTAHPDAVTLSLTAFKVPAAASAPYQPDQAIAARFDQAVQKRSSAMRAAVDQAYAILAPAAPQAPAAATAASDHYFVQASIDGKTVFFDPTLAANTPGASIVSAAGTLDPGSVPDDQFQTIHFAVVAAYLDGGTLTQTAVLDKTARTVDLIGKPLRLVVSSASANDFRAQLLLNDDRTDGDVFHLHQTSGGDSGGGVGGLGGMFGGLAGGAPPAAHKADGPPLARLWLEVTETAPGLQPFVVRRVMLDRLNGPGNALAPGQTDALARELLLQVWDGGADAGALTPSFVLKADAAELENASTSAGVAYAAAGKHAAVNVGDLPKPVLSGEIVSLFFASGLARHGIAHTLGQPVRSWYEVPRLAFLRRGDRIADWQSTTPQAVYAEDTDLFEPLFGFAGAPAAIRELALRAGITDTALEARVGSPLARPGTLSVFAAMPVGSSRRYTQSGGLPGLSSGAVLRAMSADAASPAGVVAPASFVSIAGASRYGWWAFAGGTPYALGKMEIGGGQDLAEQKELQEIPKKVKPFIEFDGNMTRCFVATAVSGLAAEGGDEAQEQMTECAVSAVCDLIADLIVDKVGETAGEGMVDEEMIQEFQKVLKGLISAAAKQGKAPLAKGCEGKVSGALQ